MSYSGPYEVVVEQGNEMAGISGRRYEGVGVSVNKFAVCV